MNIVCNRIKEEKKKCLCCGKDIFVLPVWEKDFCDSCYKIIYKELFNEQNDKLTIKELRNKIKTFIFYKKFYNLV